MFRFTVLGSGSVGNSVLVQTSETAFLIDAGFSGKELERRLLLRGFPIINLKGILITHEHGDHIKGAGIIARRYDIPVWFNELTHAASEIKVKKIPKLNFFSHEDVFAIGDCQILPFKIHHDAVNPTGFMIFHQPTGKRLTYCTDCGKLDELIFSRFATSDVVITEANYDEQLLLESEYPEWLQDRIRSHLGHLSNQDIKELLYELTSERTHTVVLGHISNKANSIIEIGKLQHKYKKRSSKMKVKIATQEKGTKWIDV